MRQKRVFPSQKVNKIKKMLFAKYHLSPQKEMGTSGYFQTIKCLGPHGKNYLVKIRKEKTKDTQIKFRREIYLNKILSHRRDAQITFSNYFASRLNNSPEWLIYYYLEGKTLGSWYEFDTVRLKNSFSKLIKIVVLLSSLSFHTSQFKKKRYLENLIEFNHYQKLLQKYFRPEEIKAGQNLIAKHRPLLDSTKLILTHGDFNPANIILTKQKKIALIDWFNAQLNNQAHDTAFIWLIMWNHRVKQKTFLNKILQNKKNKKEFSTLFKLNIIILTPKMLEIVSDVKNRLEKTSQSRLKINRKEIIKLEKAIQYYITNYRRIIRNFFIQQ